MYKYNKAAAAAETAAAVAASAVAAQPANVFSISPADSCVAMSAQHSISLLVVADSLPFFGVQTVVFVQPGDLESSSRQSSVSSL
jgi:hypothetical protein